MTTAIATVEPDEIIKLSPARERFAVLYVTKRNASDAYRGAYNLRENIKDQTVWSNASRLMADSKVKARIKQLRDMTAIPSINAVIADYEASRDGAFEDRNWSAANGAIGGIAEVAGYTRHDDKGSRGDVHIHFPAVLLGVL